MVLVHPKSTRHIPDLATKCEPKYIAHNLQRIAQVIAATAVILVLSFLQWATPATADIPGLVLNKRACVSLPANPTVVDVQNCSTGSASAGQLVYYILDIGNVSGTTIPLDINDVLPSGFNPSTSTPAPFCLGLGCPSSLTPTFSGTSTTGINIAIPAISVPSTSGNTYLVIPGYFNSSGLKENEFIVKNTITEKTLTSPKSNLSVSTVKPLPGNIAITKTQDISSVDFSANGTSGGPVIIHYTLTLTNTGPADLYLGGLLKLVDSATAFTTGSVGYDYSTSNWTCVSSPQTNLECLMLNGQLLTATPSAILSTGPINVSSMSQPVGVLTYAGPGFLPAGQSLTIEYDMEVSIDTAYECIDTNSIDGFINRAYVTFANGADSFSDMVLADNTDDLNFDVTDTGITEICPPNPVTGDPIKFTKKQISPTGLAAWGAPVQYEITVENLTTLTINNVQITDSVTMLAGMPVFDAAATNIVCISFSPTTPTVSCSSPNLNSASFISFGQTHPMASIIVDTLAPGQSVRILVDIVFKPLSCNSYTGNELRQTADTAYFSFKIPKTKYTYWQYDGQTQSVITDHEKVPPCQLKVEKEGPESITYGVPFQYTVIYSNNGPDPVSVGSLYDAIALSSPVYSSGINASYHFGCAPNPAGSVTGLGVPTDPGTSGNIWIPITINYQTQPQQGTLLLQNQFPNQPIVFAPNSSLECVIKIVLYAPTSPWPYCQGSGDPQLINTALMETTYYYNTNLTPPPDAFASTSASLPLCHAQHITKTFSSTIVEPDGPVTVTLSLINDGDDPINGASLTDIVDPTFSNITITGCGPTPCTTNLTGTTVSGTFGTLNSGQAGTVTFTANAPTTAPQVIPNTVTGSYTPPSGSWYNPANPLTATANLGVFNMEKVFITKQVVNMSPQPFPLGPFPITLSCSLNYNGFIWSQAYALNGTIPSGSTSIVVSPQPSVPVGAVCTFTETAVPSGTAPYGFSAVGYEPPTSGGLAGSLTVTLAGSNNGVVENCYGSPALTSALQTPHVVGKECPPVPVNPPDSKYRTEKICSPAVLAPDGQSYIANCQIIAWTSGEFPAGYSVQENFGANGQVNWVSTISTPPTMTWNCNPTSASSPGAIDCPFTGGTQHTGGPNQVSHHFVVNFRSEDDVINSKNCAIATIGDEVVGEDCETFVVGKDENKYDIEKVCGEVRSSTVFVPEMGNVTSNSAECVITVTATPGPVIGLLSVTDTFTSVPNSSALITSLTGAGWTCNPTPSTTAPITAGTPFTCTRPGALYPTYSDSNGQSTITATVSVPLGEDRVQNCATLALNDDRLDTSCGDIIVNTTPKVEKSCAAPYQPQGSGNWLVNCTITVTPTGPSTGTVILNDVMSLTSGSATITSVNPGIWSCSPATPITTPNSMSCSANNLTGPSTINLTMSVVPGTTGLENCAATIFNQVETDRDCVNINIPPPPPVPDIEKQCDPVVWDAATQRFKTNCTITVSASGYSNGTITIVEHMSASGGSAQLDALTQSGWTCNPATIPPAVVGTNFQVICHRPAAGFTNDTINVDLSFPLGTQGVKNCAKLYWSPQPIDLSQLPQTPLLDKSCPFLTPVDVPPVKADIQKTCTDATLLPAPNPTNAYGSTCTVTVTTSGPVQTPISFTENLFATGSTSFISSTPAGWACVPATVPNSTTMNCTYGGVVSPVSNSWDVTFNVTFPNATTANTAKNCVRLSTGNVNWNTDCHGFVAVTPTPFDLGATKSCVVYQQLSDSMSILDCTITVTANGSPFPPVITLTENLQSTATNAGSFMNLLGVGSTDAWTCPPSGTPVGPNTPINCTIPGSSFPAGGTSILHAYMTYNSSVTPGLTQNCVTVAGNSTPPTSSGEICVPIGPPAPTEGRLAIIKQAKLNGQNIPQQDFPFTVTCGSTVTNVDVQNDGGVGLVTSIPFGTSCTVVENQPPLTGVCPVGQTASWSTTYSPATLQTFTAQNPEQTVTVLNTLTCTPLDPPIYPFVVKKVVVNNAPGSVAGLVFPITVSCPNRPNSNILTTSMLGGNSGVIYGSVLNDNCTISEGAYPATTACGPLATPAWTTVISPSSPITVGTTMQTVTVKNTLNCVPIVVPLNGRLTVKKVVVAPQGVVVPATTNFPVTVNCGTAQNGNISVNTPWSLNGLSTTATCTVAEDVSTLPTTGICPQGETASWSVSPPSQTLTPTVTGVTAIITNKLICTPAGRLQVKKVVDVPQGVNINAVNFPVTVNCGGNQQTGTISVNTPWILNGLATNASCFVQEQTPPTANICPSGQTASWSTIYTPPSQTVTPTAGGVQVKILNTLKCTPVVVPLNGRLTVKKVVVAPQGVVVPASTNFPVTVNCGTPQNGNISVNTSWSLNGLSTTADCTVTEDVSALPTTGICSQGQTASWSASPPTQSVTPTSGGVAVTITNTLNCVTPSTTGSLSLTKACGPAMPAAGGGVDVQCTITVNVTGGQVPPVIILTEKLDELITMNPGAAQIISFTSAEPWDFPPLPVNSEVNATMNLIGSYLPSNGISTINVTMHFNDVAMLSEMQNCVSGFAGNWSQTGGSTAPQICQQLTGFPPNIVVPPDCNNGAVKLANGKCGVPPPPTPKCDTRSTVLQDGKCVCKVPGAEPVSKTACACPNGTELLNSKCRVPPPPTPKCDTRSTVLQDGKCVCKVPGAVPVSKTACGCPDGTELIKGKCRVPPPELKCDTRSAVPSNGKCVCKIQGAVPVSPTACGCPDGTELIKGKCRVPAPVLKCDRDTTVAKGGACVCRFRGMRPVSETECACRRGSTFVAGKGCVVERADCPEGTVRKGDLCIRIKSDEPRGKDCPPGTRKVGPLCVRVKLKDADPIPENPAGPGKLCLDREGKEVPCD